MIAVWVLAALVAASPLDYMLAAAVTVSLGEKLSILYASSVTNVPEAGKPAISTVTVTVQKTIPVSALSSASITSVPEPGSAATTAESKDYMTIAISNAYGKALSLSFASNAGGPSPISNPSATKILDNAFTQYAFPTGWAGRVYVGPNLNPDGSKIEGSYTGRPDIDVSYVDGYSVSITCSSQGVAVSGCNIDLFK